MPTFALRPAVFVTALLLLVAWDVSVGGQLAQSRKPGAAFRVLSGLCGLLVAPALLLSLGGQSALTGRALVGLAWLWPLVSLLCVAQVAHVLGRRLVSPLVAAPLLAFNVALAFMAAVRFALQLGYEPPSLALVPGIGYANLLAPVLGAAAVTSPFVVAAPLLAPASPARTRSGHVMRTVLAIFAATAVAALASAWTAARAGLDAYAQLETRAPVRLHPGGEFTTGLRILPELESSPAAAALRQDLALTDSLGVGALLVRVTPAGCTALALDSLERALEPYRRDSLRLIVALTYGRNAGRERARAPTRFVEDRRADVDRIVRHLKPEYLIPADEPYGTGAAALGELPVDWWEEYFTDLALVAHRLRPATRVMMTLSASGARDATLYEWATRRASPVDVTAFSISPSRGGALAVRAALETADSLMQVADGAHEHWIIVTAAPAVEGEEAQRRLVRHVLAWGAARPYVAGVVLADAADYDRLTGFRSASGRLRRATADVAAAIRLLAESPTPSPPR